MGRLDYIGSSRKKGAGEENRVIDLERKKIIKRTAKRKVPNTQDVLIERVSKELPDVA